MHMHRGEKFAQGRKVCTGEKSLGTNCQKKMHRNHEISSTFAELSRERKGSRSVSQARELLLTEDHDTCKIQSKELCGMVVPETRQQEAVLGGKLNPR